MGPLTAGEAAGLALRLLAFYDREGRDLPWRRERDLYRIWVSEIMLQQTGVTTVIPYYRRFLERFPDLPGLAAADGQAVLASWQGLGYYGRARNLLAAARLMLEEHGGRVPEAFDVLVRLPGIGPSTAAAILAIGRDQPQTIFDGNVKRVLARLVALAEPSDSGAGKRELLSLARQLTPRRRPGDYAQAIMDLGATLCTVRRPDCPRCPWAAFCRAWDRGRGRPESYPVLRPKPARGRRSQITLRICDGRGWLLFGLRPARGLLGGLWELPSTLPVGEGAEPSALAAAALAERLGLCVEEPVFQGAVRHGFTHFHLTAAVFACRHLAGEPGVGAAGYTDFLWADRTRPPPLSTLHRKMLGHGETD